MGVGLEMYVSLLYKTIGSRFGQPPSGLKGLKPNRPLSISDCCAVDETMAQASVAIRSNPRFAWRSVLLSTFSPLNEAVCFIPNAWVLGWDIENAMRVLFGCSRRGELRVEVTEVFSDYI